MKEAQTATAVLKTTTAVTEEEAPQLLPPMPPLSSPGAFSSIRRPSPMLAVSMIRVRV